uniref:Putative plant transposon protein domain-containing protein n=1 Tax=Nicotiana tabacum TaxID=4097 RepID=A0A1S4ALS8_TOBAC|nr:PREDICTED: uncharacterized protein LOC107798873 [Nicotiana tabacum]
MWRRLVKDGKIVNKKAVHVVNIDDEMDKEPGSLTRKFSHKHSISKSKSGSSMSVASQKKSAGDNSGEKLVEESVENVMEESVGKVSEKTMPEKGKSDRKSVKRKGDAREEPCSSKKAKVDDTYDARKEKLKNQKVLWGHTFAPDILDMTGMRQLVEICEFQQWTHLFAGDNPKVYEEEVRSFYDDFFTVEDDHICMMVNGVNFVMDSAVLNAIVKDKTVQQRERVHKKALLPVYQLLFEMVNKVLLPRDERRSITSRAYLVLMEALDSYTTINLPGIIIEHMRKVAEFKDGNHGLPYGFLLTNVFEFFKVPLGKAKVGTRTQTFFKTTLEECECIDKVGGVSSTFTISQLINAQNSATDEIRKLKAKNAILEGQLSQLREAPGSSSSQSTEVAHLTKENADLKKQVEDLKE